MLSSSSFLFFVFFVICPTVLSFYHNIDGLKNYHQLPLPGVAGPESLAFDCNGKGPYAGVSDGRILLWQGPQLGWTEFATTAPNRQDYIYNKYPKRVTFYFYFIKVHYIFYCIFILWIKNLYLFGKYEMFTEKETLIYRRQCK